MIGMGEQTRQKERAVELKVASLAQREAANTRAQPDPVSGMIWPNGSYLGPSAEMAQAGQLIAMSLTVDQQCAVIAERCAAMRAKTLTGRLGGSLTSLGR